MGNGIITGCLNAVGVGRMHISFSADKSICRILAGVLGPLAGVDTLFLYHRALNSKKVSQQGAGLWWSSSQARTEPGERLGWDLLMATSSTEKPNGSRHGVLVCISNMPNI